MGIVRLAALATWVAACGSVHPEREDAGLPIDAAVDAPGSARACDPDRPMPVEPTTNGSMEGTWHVIWGCAHGCAMRRPGLTYSPELEIVGSTQLWTNTLCPECRATFVGAETIDGCIDVSAATDFDSQCRFSYRICEMDGELHGQVTWKEPGVSAMTWQITGRR